MGSEIARNEIILPDVMYTLGGGCRQLRSSWLFNLSIYKSSCHILSWYKEDSIMEDVERELSLAVNDLEHLELKQGTPPKERP